jgi:hypothetical protein
MIGCRLVMSISLISAFLITGIEFQESLDQSDLFKPGWKDIFRMNQNELESEIRKVYRDSTLDPRRKSYLVQNLLTRLFSGDYDMLYFSPI